MATTTSTVGVISPDQVQDLITIPVEAHSIALQASTLTTTVSTETRFPYLATDVSSDWTAENAEITQSDPTLDEIVVTPSKIAALHVMSSEAGNDTNPAIAGIVGDSMVRSIAKDIDAAFFGAKGGNAVQQAGLEDLTGFTAVDPGTDWADLDAFVEAIYNAENLGLTVNSFVANPADAKILAQLKVSTGSNQPLLGTDPTNPTRRVIQGVQLLVAPGVTQGTIWGLPKNRLHVVRRNDTELAVDKSVYFTSDRVAIRATARYGFGFSQPEGVQKITLAAV